MRVVRRRRTVGERRVSHGRQRFAGVRQRRGGEPDHEQHEIVADQDAEHRQVDGRQTGPHSCDVRSTRHLGAVGPVLSEDHLPVRERKILSRDFYQ